MADALVPPMLARLVRELPEGDYLFEPKWDGLRCLAFVSAGRARLQSRHGRPLARYFPELVEALAPLGDATLDGEIIVVGREGLDFAALLTRIHPAATRVESLRRETPATFIAFDLLAQGGEDLMGRPFAERRGRLERMLAGAQQPLVLTPITADREVAGEWLRRFQGRGIDGVVAKARSLRYEPGKRAMVKVKSERTADCVVAGFRLLAAEGVASLLLGLWDGAALRHVGVASSFTRARRRELGDLLGPLVVPLAGHPWEHGFGLGRSPIGRLPGSAGRWDPEVMERDWYPVAPSLVCEVAYDQLDERRFRHPARFVRWRPDRDARSCTFEQLEAPPPPIPEELLR